METRAIFSPLQLHNIWGLYATSVALPEAYILYEFPPLHLELNFCSQRYKRRCSDFSVARSHLTYIYDHVSDRTLRSVVMTELVLKLNLQMQS